MTDAQKIKELGQKLDNKFNELIEKEVTKLKERGKEDNSDIFGPTAWSLPSHIIAFLQPTIEKLDDVSKFRL